MIYQKEPLEISKTRDDPDFFERKFFTFSILRLTIFGVL